MKPAEIEHPHLVQRLKSSSSPARTLAIILTVALLGGIGTGYVLSTGNKGGSANPAAIIGKEAPKTAHQDTKTFKDFAEGKITKKPAPKKGEDYGEGTHLLVRENGVPVALTSSVVDLSQYENKKVKVYGETQKAIKEGWLMDIGMVEEIK